MILNFMNFRNYLHSSCAHIFLTAHKMVSETYFRKHTDLHEAVQEVYSEPIVYSLINVRNSLPQGV